MIHRLLLTSMTLFSLATCQTQNAAKTETATNVTQNEVQTNTQTTTMTQPKKGEPEMSTGLPPDQEALDTAKKEQQQASTDKAGVIYLKEGENKFLKEYDMNVTFKRLVEDSRCPKGVQCVWAGNATAEIELMGTYTRPVTLKISTTDNASKGYYTTQEFNGYAISLVEVTPETTSAKGFNALKGSYKIALKFEKGNPVDSKTQRGGTTSK
ncbi:hypothetical protein [Kaistella carnis]|uniref:Lipoprotein n=1 Tax=Kaistella carnis TaxID=1241979 RepID=A0A3G8XVE7_9FLAO|nr:hypothetical protein [Kaistella carnis]AZI34194.1 hypothetical protein EIB73_13860 [Kaistella carnis]